MPVEEKSVRCPNCGGNLVFDPVTQSSRCEYCGSSYAMSAAGAVESTCPNCGASLKRNEAGNGFVCTACGGTFLDEAQKGKESTLPERPAKIIPFRVPMEKAKTTFVQWLGKGDYVPADLYDRIQIVSIEGAYIPYYHFSVAYETNYQCAIDHGEQTQLFSNTLKGTHNLDSIASKFLVELKLNKVERQGEYQNSYSDLMLFLNKKQPYLEEACPYDERYLGGYTTMPFQLEPEDTFERFAKPVTERYLKHRIIQMAGGSVRNLYMDHNFHQDQKELLESTYYRPFYLIHYLYEGQGYLFVMDGCLEDQFAGTKPFSSQKQAVVKFARIPMWFFLCLMGVLLILSTTGMTTGPFMVAAFFGALISWIGSVVFRDYYEKALQKKLQQRREALSFNVEQYLQSHMLSKREWEQRKAP